MIISLARKRVLFHSTAVRTMLLISCIIQIVFTSSDLSLRLRIASVIPNVCHACAILLQDCNYHFDVKRSQCAYLGHYIS